MVNYEDLVKKWTRYYKKLLSIQHWNTLVELVGPEEISDNDGVHQGLCLVTDTLLEARIKLLDPTTINLNHPSWAGFDLQGTLLHELIHVLLEPCNIPEDKVVPYEQAVICLERAIRKLQIENEELKRKLDGK